jgi:hypothetical protein
MRKNVVSILTWPFRALGKLLRLLLKAVRALGKPFAKLKKRRAKTAAKRAGPGRGKPSAKLAQRRGKPFAKLAKLRGKQRIAAFVALGVLLLAVVLALRPGPNEDERVRATLDRYAAASRDKDYQTLCDSLLASDLVDRIRSAGLPCEVALRTGLENRKNPTLTVLGVEVSGDQALAKVRGSAAGEVPAVASYRLVREDDQWRIASSPGAPGAGP